MPVYLNLMYYPVVLLFGIAVSLLLSGVEYTKKNIFFVACFCILEFFIQYFFRKEFGLDFIKKLCPILVHIPLALLIWIVLKKPLNRTIVSIFSAYLCCQIPRWIASAGFLFDRNYPLYNLVYICAVILSYGLFKKYIVKSMQQFMQTSKKICILLGIVPFFYYVFDYLSTVYTNTLLSGAKPAVQFMPSLVSVFYFIFVLLYYTEVKKQEIIQRDKDMLKAQINQANKEMELLRKMQETTAVYRHNMKHHVLALQGFAQQNNIEKITSYLEDISSSIDTIAHYRFTGNETVNLILSAFKAKAEESNIAFNISANLPKTLPITDSEICSLLSNAIDNAIAETKRVDNLTKRQINLSMTVHKSNLLIEIENTCIGVPQFVNGLPQSNKAGHGFGTKSILSISESYNGQALFTFLPDKNAFNVKIIIPLIQKV